METVLYPDTVEESIAKVRRAKEEDWQRKLAREQEIEKRLSKAVTVRQQIEQKIAQKEAEIRAQQVSD